MSAAAAAAAPERYRWKPGTRLKSDPQACGERIKEMRECLGRALSRDDIAADAKSKSSPFHEDVYEFDDVKAAHTYRLEVASLILRGIDIVEVRVVDKKPVEVSTPFIQHVPGHGYEIMATVLSDTDLERRALESIVSGLEAWRVKLARFQSLVKKFDSVIVEANRLLAKKTRAQKKSGKN